MNPPASVAYVIPAHNEEQVLEATTKELLVRLAELPGSEIILVENGSTDGTAAMANDLAAAAANGPVPVRAERSAKGYGNAVRRGIEVATADLVMLTAADLPFKFSDLDAALSLVPLPEVVIGSKAHPESKVAVNMQRKVMSRAFRVVRRALLGIDIGDTQGTILIGRVLALSLIEMMESGGYFFSTELVTVAARSGRSVIEVPIDYSNPRPNSKVRVVRDSIEVLRDTVALRGRVRRLAPRLAA